MAEKTPRQKKRKASQEVAPLPDDEKRSGFTDFQSPAKSHSAFHQLCVKKCKSVKISEKS